MHGRRVSCTDVVCHAQTSCVVHIVEYRAHRGVSCTSTCAVHIVVWHAHRRVCRAQTPCVVHRRRVSCTDVMCRAQTPCVVHNVACRAQKPFFVHMRRVLCTSSRVMHRRVSWADAVCRSQMFCVVHRRRASWTDMCVVYRHVCRGQTRVSWTDMCVVDRRRVLCTDAVCSAETRGSMTLRDHIIAFSGLKCVYLGVCA